MAACRCSFLSADALPQGACVITMSTAKTSVRSPTSPKHGSSPKILIDQRGSPTNRFSSHTSHMKHPAVSALPEMTVWNSPLRSLLGAVASCTPKICARASCASTCSWRARPEKHPPIFLCLSGWSVRTRCNRLELLCCCSVSSRLFLAR